jgi:3-dehydroquinate synthase
MRKSLSFTFGGFSTEVTFHDSLDLPALSSQCPAGAMFVFDRTTYSLFGGGASNGSRPHQPRAVVLRAGERAKSWKSVELVLRGAVMSGFGRDMTMIGVGGGVVSDLTAFAASLYMRGCGLVLVPTTLLGMVDASLGGKTGMDFAGFKNLVGTFYPASRLTVVTLLLSRLPRREYFSGLAEVIKTAMIGDAGLLTLLKERREEIFARDAGVLAEVVWRCLRVKGAIVSTDFREEGRRAVLNLGHTFGHAMESCSGFSGWTHGEAVAWGIGKAIEAGLALGETDSEYAEEVIWLLGEYGYRLEADVGAEKLIKAMGMDKKRRRGRIRLVLSRAPGDAAVFEVDEPLIARVLSKGAVAQ